MTLEEAEKDLRDFLRRHETSMPVNSTIRSLQSALLDSVERTENERELIYARILRRYFIALRPDLFPPPTLTKKEEITNLFT